MLIENTPIKIQKIEKSRIEKIDFENVPFGRVFSDHMFVMDYIQGEWQQPEIIPFGNLSMSPATSVIHYGQSIFEGLKAFRNSNGEIFLFRPDQNIERFNRSAERMCMPKVPTDLLLDALTQLISLDKNWVPDIEGSALYVRPFMFGTDEYIGVKPSETYRLVIFTCPVNKYYAGNVKVKIETHYTRSVRGGTGFAKAAGNYAGALFPAKLAQDKGYNQLVWTDALEHKYIEESGTMNIIFKSGNKIFTPALSDSILSGITRLSILQLAKDWGYEVEERKISVEEIETLLKSSMLDEAFGAGTAATVACIDTMGIGDIDYTLPDPASWSFAPKVSKMLDLIKRGKEQDTHSWNYKIC